MFKPMLMIAMLCLGSSRAFALDLPSEITLPQLLELVSARNPELLGEQSRVDAADADIKTARALPNPEVSYYNFTPQILVEQSLPIFGQRGLRIQSAQLEAEAVRAEVSSVGADVLRDAALAFTQLLVAQERRRLHQAVYEDLMASIVIVRGQVEAGARSRYDLARIELERAQAQAELERSEAELASSVMQLAIAVGQPEWRPVALGKLQPSREPLTFDALWPQAEYRLSSLRAAAAAETAAEKRSELARREALPTTAITVGEQRERGARDFVYGVSISIPVFDRQQGAIGRARAEANRARLQNRAQRLAAETALRRATDQLAQRRALTERFERDGLSQLPELRRMARDAYKLGQGGILELIDAIQSVAQKQLAHLELLESVFEAEIAVQAASGLFTNSAEPVTPPG
ncbi:TolC family protein [Steroidobacter cummioxidans]|uniref:TolC family protein n=1 Tax=Steroidobacter cummioxidans TaxID=1803913 RepID=UPI0019D48C89|nr:TolC family protein [Steroidobacter cummioxidans]